MAIKASDLSSSDKRRLLDALRQQIGDLQYDEFVNSHGEDALVNMVLGMSNEETLPKKNEDWDKASLGCFGVLWLILSIGVAAFTNRRIAVGFFFSPLLYFLFFGLPGLIVSSLLERLPWGCVLIVVLGILVLLSGVAQSPSKNAGTDVLAVAFIGWFAAWVVAWLAGALVRMMRRVTGRW